MIKGWRAPGACLGLLGPNGAGKTTTLRMVYGVTRPDSGTIRVFGRDVTRETKAVRARLGVTLQDSAMIDTLKVIDRIPTLNLYYYKVR